MTYSLLYGKNFYVYNEMNSKNSLRFTKNERNEVYILQEELREMREKMMHLESEVGELKQQLSKIETLLEKKGLDKQLHPSSFEHEKMRREEKDNVSSPVVPQDEYMKQGALTSASVEKAEPDRTIEQKKDYEKRGSEPISEINAHPKKKMDVESLLGIWLPRIFMFILLLGVLWGLKIGMDNGWITNPVRVVVGYASTGVLLFAGMKYVRQKKHLFGHTLLGGFIALGILTTFAAHHLYGYFDAVAAFGVGIIYIVIGMILSTKMNSETLTVFSAIAGFLLPFLLEGAGAPTFMFCLYILLLFLSLFYVSLKQKHTYTFYIIFLLFHLTLFIYLLVEGVVGEEAIIVGTVAVQHVLLLFYYLNGSVSRGAFTEVLLYTNFLFTISWVKLLEIDQEGYVYGLFALLYVLLTLYLFRKKASLLQGMITAVAVFAVSIWLLSIQWNAEQVRAILLLLNGAIGLWIGLTYQSIRTIITSAFIYVLTVYFIVLFVQIESLFTLEHLVWLVLILTMVSIYYSIYASIRTKMETKKALFDKSLIVGQVFVFLYMNHVIDALLPPVVQYPTTIYVKTLVFLVALLLMYTFRKWKHGLYVTHAAFIGFGVLGMVLMVLPMTNYYNQGFFFHLFVQFIYVVLCTVCFIAIYRNVFYLNKGWLTNHVPKLAVLLQVVYFIFINKWYLSVTDVWLWDREYVFLGHTFLLFIFAFTSISLGGKMFWKSVRIGGFILVVLCVFKLFFVDLANVSIVLRAILFTVVGVAGLLYSRTLIKDDKNN